MEKQSRYSYSETVERLSRAITDAGNTIFITIDQARAAEGAGLKLRPTALIVFGNPKAGTPLMEAFPSFALDLPLKMLVWEEGGGTKVAYPEIAALAKSHGIPDDDPRVAGMARALEALSNSVV